MQACLLRYSLTLAKCPHACMDLLKGWKIGGRGQRKFWKPLEAESRNRRPQRQRVLMARLASASPQEATVSWQRGPPSLPRLLAA